MKAQRNLVPAIRELEAEVRQIEAEYRKELEPLTTSIAQLRKLNTACEKCCGNGRVLRSRTCAEDDRPDPDDPTDYIMCDRCFGSGMEPKEEKE